MGRRAPGATQWWRSHPLGAAPTRCPVFPPSYWRIGAWVHQGSAVQFYRLLPQSHARSLGAAAAPHRATAASRRSDVKAASLGAGRGMLPFFSRYCECVRAAGVWRACLRTITHSFAHVKQPLNAAVTDAVAATPRRSRFGLCFVFVLVTYCCRRIFWRQSRKVRNGKTLSTVFRWTRRRRPSTPPKGCLRSVSWLPLACSLCLTCC